MNKTAAVILNWNSSEDTINLIWDLKEAKNEKLDIIVVDNNSSKKEKNKLKNFFRRQDKYRTLFLNDNDDINDIENFDKDNIDYYLILLDENYGYAKGNNYGLKFSKKLGYKYSLVLNNDIVIEKKITKKLEKEMELDHNLALIGPKVIGPLGQRQGPHQRPSFFEWFWYPLFMPFLYLPRFIYKKIFVEKEPYWLLGCCMFFNNKIVDEIGYFDENTFLYLEEVIISEKIFSNGYEIKYLSDVEIKHMHGATTSMIGRKKKLNYLIDSVKYYFDKYRNCNNYQINLIIAALYIRTFVWDPIIDFIK